MEGKETEEGIITLPEVMASFNEAAEKIARQAEVTPEGVVDVRLACRRALTAGENVEAIVIPCHQVGAGLYFLEEVLPKLLGYEGRGWLAVLSSRVFLPKTFVGDLFSLGPMERLDGIRQLGPSRLEPMMAQQKRGTRPFPGHSAELVGQIDMGLDALYGKSPEILLRRIRVDLGRAADGLKDKELFCLYKRISLVTAAWHDIATLPWGDTIMKIARGSNGAVYDESKEVETVMRLYPAMESFLAKLGLLPFKNLILEAIAGQRPDTLIGEMVNPRPGVLKLDAVSYLLSDGLEGGILRLGEDRLSLRAPERFNPKRFIEALRNFSSCLTKGKAEEVFRHAFPLSWLDVVADLELDKQGNLVYGNPEKLAALLLYRLVMKYDCYQGPHMLMREAQIQKAIESLPKKRREDLLDLEKLLRLNDFEFGALMVSLFGQDQVDRWLNSEGHYSRFLVPREDITPEVLEQLDQPPVSKVFKEFDLDPCLETRTKAPDGSTVSIGNHPDYQLLVELIEKTRRRFTENLVVMVDEDMMG